MATTTNLGITLVEQSQAQKEVTINQAFSVLDAFVGKTVVDKDLATPPASPAPSALYIVAASPSGAWAGKAMHLAYYDQVWRFIAPVSGMLMWVQDESLDYRFNGTAWIAVSGSAGGAITGPATSTSTALVRWNSTTGAAVQNSGILVDASNNVTGAASIASGAVTVTSAAASAFAVGAAGVTNPAFAVDASTVSSATGLLVKSAAAAAGLAVSVQSSGANENLTLNAKGAGTIAIGNVSSGAITLSRATSISGALTQTGGNSAFSPATSSTAAGARYLYTGAADTALTLSTEAPSVYFNMGQVRQHATGALTLQRDYRVTPSTHSFVAASTLTDAYGTYIDGAPIAGTNATITNSYSLGLGANAVGAGVTNSYGLIVNPNTGATNNFGSWLRGITIIDNYRGTTTNDNAAAGMVGEFISATVLSGAAVAIATATPTNITSISLTPGDWDVSGFVSAGYTGSAMTRLLGWTSATSATLPVFPNNGGAGGHESLNGTSGIGLNTLVGVQRFSLASTTTIYLTSYVAFSSGAAAVFGFIRARRMR